MLFESMQKSTLSKNYPQGNEFAKREKFVRLKRVWIKLSKASENLR
jgi:hypothetical protein